MVGQSTCLDRIKPKLVEFHHKVSAFVAIHSVFQHNQLGTASRYDQLREANRHQQPYQPSSAYNLTTPPQYDQQQPTDSLSMPIDKPTSRFIYDDPNSIYISGTPTQRSSVDSMDIQQLPPPRSTSSSYSKAKGKNAYGDVDFS